MGESSQLYVSGMRVEKGELLSIWHDSSRMSLCQSCSIQTFDGFIGFIGIFKYSCRIRTIKTVTRAHTRVSQCMF